MCVFAFFFQEVRLSIACILDGPSLSEGEEYISPQRFLCSHCSGFAIMSLQEIYPPKSTEFAYVADGAFEVPDIHEFELIMLKVLKYSHFWAE